MKKSLIALAALSAFATAVQAQSSVTVYGVLDIAVSDAKSTTSAGVSTSTTTQSGTNNVATSVIGLKGSEDLGGGLTAIFELQGNFNTNTGVLGTANTTLGDTMFDRQSYVGLSDKKLGTLKLGRTSDVLDSTEGFANFVQFFDTETAGANGLGNKNANTVRYDSPVIQGVSIAAAYSSDAVATAQATSSSQGSSTTAFSHSGNVTKTYGINYVNGPLTVGYATGSANVTTSIVDGKLSTAYAGYNFGFADVRIQQTKDKAVDQTAGSSAFYQYKTDEISASIPLPMLGNGVSAVVHYEDAKYETEAGRSAAGYDYSQYGILVRKDLSKRTSLYAGFKDKDVNAGTDVKTTAVGVVHSF
jgi:predicted porin